jgi:hypothetical protein
MRLLLTAVWFFHVLLAAGAGYAVLRLWQHRHQQFINQLGKYMTGFVVEGAGWTAMLYVTAGQRTWTVVLTWVISTLMADLPRIPLIMFIIRGPNALPPAEPPTSGEQKPEYWLAAFNRIARRAAARQQKRRRST